MTPGASLHVVERGMLNSFELCYTLIGPCFLSLWRKHIIKKTKCISDYFHHPPPPVFPGAHRTDSEDLRAPWQHMRLKYDWVKNLRIHDYQQSNQVNG